ncbi:MAG: hypothetical protein J0L88_04685 [Xanthomonadales bacterium]|nr:hypothetical protein [Xanthomonadales bacterium]
MIFFEARDLTIEETRQRLFEQRDALVQAVASGVVSCDHPAYANTRKGINAFIRYAHEIGFLRLIIGRMFRAGGGGEKATNDRSDLVGLNESSVQEILQIRKQAEYWMVLHVIKRSLVLSSVLVVAAGLKIGLVLVTGSVRKVLSILLRSNSKSSKALGEARIEAVAQQNRADVEAHRERRRNMVARIVRKGFEPSLKPAIEDTVREEVMRLEFAQAA